MSWPGSARLTWHRRIHTEKVVQDHPVEMRLNPELGRAHELSGHRPPDAFDSAVLVHREGEQGPPLPPTVSRRDHDRHMRWGGDDEGLVREADRGHSQ